MDPNKKKFNLFRSKKDAPPQQQTQAGPANGKKTNPYTFDPNNPNAQHPQTSSRVPTNASDKLSVQSQNTRRSWGKSMSGGVVTPDTIKSTNYMYNEMKFAIDYSGMRFRGFYPEQLSSTKGFPAILRVLDEHGGGIMSLIDELPDKEGRYQHVVSQVVKQSLFSRKQKAPPQIFPLDICVKNLFDWFLVLDNDAKFNGGMIRDNRNFVEALESTYKKWHRCSMVVPVFVIHAIPGVGRLIIHDLSKWANEHKVPATGKGLYEKLHAYLLEQKMLVATVTTQQQQEDALKFLMNELIEKPLLQNPGNILGKSMLEKPVVLSYWTCFNSQMAKGQNEDYGLFRDIASVAASLEHHKNVGSFGGRNAVRLITSDMSYAVASKGMKTFWEAGDDSHRVKRNVDSISSLPIEAEQQKEHGLGALTVPQYHERFVNVDLFGDALDSIKAKSAEAKELERLKPTWQTTPDKAMSEIPAETYRNVQSKYGFYKANPETAKDPTVAPAYASAVPIPQDWVKNAAGTYFVAPSGHAYTEQEAGPHTHIGYHIPQNKLPGIISCQYPHGVFTPAGGTAGRIFHNPGDRVNNIADFDHEDMMKSAYRASHPALTAHANGQYNYNAQNGQAFHKSAITGEIEHIGYHYTPTNLDAHPYHGIVPPNMRGYGQDYIGHVKQKFPGGVFSKDGVNWHTPPINGVAVSPETKIGLGYHGPFQALHAQYHPEAYNVTPHASPAVSTDNLALHHPQSPYDAYGSRS